MQQITIRQITIEGFRSYVQPVTFKFNNTGLHLIKGNNGDGKTTLFSALTWSLYKVNLNNTNNAKVVTYKWMRGDSWKGTRVQVLFGIGKYKYLVARHINYAGKTKGIEGHDALLIFRKEKVDKTPFTEADIVNEPLYKEDAQAYLDKMLGIDSKTFLNSILFGQRMNRLMETKDADKRDLFERLFDVDFIDALKDKAAAKASEKQAELTAAEQQILLCTARVADTISRIADAQEILTEFTERRKRSLKQIKIDFDATKAALAEAINKVEKLSAKSGATTNIKALADAEIKASGIYTNAKVDQANHQRAASDLQRNITKAKAEHEVLWAHLKNIKTTCPVCGSKIAAGDVAKAKEAIEKQIEANVALKRKLEHEATQSNSMGEQLSSAIKIALAAYEKALDAHSRAKQLRNSDDELDTWKDKKSELSTRLKMMRNAYDNEKAKQPPTIDIAALQQKLDATEAALLEAQATAKKKVNYLKRIAWWQKAFGANGLKSYIFSSMLNHLNNCVSAYTSYFGITVIFGIDLSKASKPFYARVILDGVNEVDYADLSGGQRQKIDLCIACGMQDATETVTAFNISIYDEPESGLDAETLEVFDTLLRLRSATKAIYVITHYQLLDLSGATVYEVSGGKSTTTTIE